MQSDVKNILFFLLLFTTQALSAAGLDSLTNLLHQESQKSNHQKEIELILEISQLHAKANEFEKSISFLEEATKKAEKIKNWESYQEAITQKAKVYMSMGQSSEAIDILKDLAEDIKSGKGKSLAEVYYEIAILYRKTGSNEQAYEYNLKGLEIFEEQKDTFNIVRSLYGMGTIFFYQDNYEIALEYYQKTLDLSTAATIDKYIFNSLGAIGSSYNRIRQTEKSLEYNRQAYDLAKKLDYKSGLPYAVMNLGGNYAALKEYNKALIYYEEALELNRENRDAWGECGTLRVMGEALLEAGDHKKSIEYLNQALEIAKQKGFRPRVVELYRTIAYYYEQIKDYKNTAEYIEKYAALKDSLANETTLQKMSDSKTQYEILQKEKELALKDAEFITQQRTFLLFSIGILLFVVWLLFKQNRIRAKGNAILAEKNKQIEKQNEELASAYDLQKETNEKIKEQNQQLEQSNIELKRFAFIASHDLKEPLRTIGSYANLLQRRYRHKIDDNANEFLDYITESTKRLYTLLNDVLDYSKLNVNKKESELTDTNEAIKIANENLSSKIANKNAEISIGQLPKITADKLHLVQLFQNLIDNSIKYSESQKPKVEIASKQNNGFYEFSVKDNGIGINPQLQPKIFEMFKRLHNREKYEGNGIGLAICKKIVQEYGGKIWVESAEGEGSTFYFTFPVPENDLNLAA